MSETALVELAHITFAYPGNREVFRDLHFFLRAGDRIGLHGPNGSGKTTLFRLITGLERPQSGSVLFRGRPVRAEKDFYELRRAVGFVLQNADDQLFCPTVLEDVAFGPLNLGLRPEEARERALETLRDLGLEGLDGRLTHTLSGGEKKLVSLASVLSMRPEALLLDEPTNGLDPDACERIAAVLAALPVARVIISHDRDFLERTSADMLVMEHGALRGSAR